MPAVVEVPCPRCNRLRSYRRAPPRCMRCYNADRRDAAAARKRERARARADRTLPGQMPLPVRLEAAA
jgi:hypothetical protein